MTVQQVGSAEGTAQGDDRVARKAHDPLAAIRDRLIDELKGSPRHWILAWLRRIPGLLLVTGLFLLLVISGLLTIFTLIQ